MGVLDRGPPVPRERGGLGFFEFIGLNAIFGSIVVPVFDSCVKS